MPDVIKIREEYEKIRISLDKLLPKECGNCGETVSLHIHHVVPISVGGSNRASNLVRLCNVCHSKAHGGNSFIAKSDEARRDNAINGKHAAGSIPLGYVTDKNRRYVIDEDSAEIVRLIFRLRYQSELSTSNIAAYLNHMLIPTVRGASKWSHPAVNRMLNNPQYLGKSVHRGEFLGDDIYPVIIDGELAESIKVFENKYQGRRLPGFSIPALISVWSPTKR